MWSAMAFTTGIRIRCRSHGRMAFAAIVFPLLSLYPLAARAQVASPAGQSAPTGAERTVWTLEDVLAAAMVQHPLIEAARARIGGAQGDRRTAGAAPNPVATYWVENAGFPGQASVPGLDRETSAYVTLPIEPFFQRSARVQRADEDIKAADAALTTARRQVALDVVHAFFRVALAQVAVETAEENRAGLEQLAAYNRSRVDEGATAEGEWIRVQVELDRAATQLVLAQVDLARSRAELRPFLGDAIAPAGSLDSIRVSVPVVGGPGLATPPPLVEFLTRTRQNRPELISAHARVAAAAAAVDIERTLTVRQVGATVGMKRAGDHNSMIAGVGIAIPLFDRNRGGVQRATAERLAAEQELAWAERTVGAEVQAAYESAQRLSAQVSGLPRSFLDRAEESRTITLSAYQEGAATLLQVLDSSRAVAEARLIYSRLTFAHAQSLFDLTVAAGGEVSDALTSLHASRAITPNVAASDGGAR
jgi:cobalt-zinc-cadmium efflux system outer membrane protein